jgi:hypothetical protein
MFQGPSGVICVATDDSDFGGLGDLQWYLESYELIAVP